MGNPDECSDHKIIDKPNSCNGFDHDGKFCDVWFLMKQKYPRVKGILPVRLTICQIYFFIKQSHREAKIIPK